MRDASRATLVSAQGIAHELCGAGAQATTGEGLARLELLLQLPIAVEGCNSNGVSVCSGQACRRVSSA